MNSMVKSILMYACESWTLTEKMKKMMTSFEFKCYMRLLGITSRDKKTNEYVSNEICKQFNGRITTDHFPTHIKERMLKFFGHQTRRHKMTRVLIQGHSDGNRCLGKPKRTLNEDITEWTGCNIQEASWRTTDLRKWRASVYAWVHQRPGLQGYGLHYDDDWSIALILCAFLQ